MNGLSYEEAVQRLRDAGLRATPCRVQVLRLLANSSRPLSHAQVVVAINNGAWNQVTLYRSLVRLAEVGLARVTGNMDGAVRYESCTEQQPTHPHFICQTCGVVECLPGVRLGGRTAPQWQLAIDRAELQLFGQCPDCIEERCMRD